MTNLYPPSQTRSSVLSRVAITLLVTFLVIFPKGGIKVGEVPITFGYLLLGAVCALTLLINVRAGSLLRLSKAQAIVLGAMLPFQVWIGVVTVLNGFEVMGFLIALYVSLIFVPLAFVWLLAPQMGRIDLNLLMRQLRFGIFLVAAYGIVLFIYKLTTGSFLEIPYLTVNEGDLGAMDEKHINRGSLFKLISTYNNGNIYGICLLILLPLYTWLEPRFHRQVIVKASLVLTLSRTVWIGLLLYELLARVYIKRISAGALAGLMFGVVMLLAGVLYALHLMGLDPDFLFDRNLGGRAEQFETSLSPVPLETYFGISEVVYMSVLDQFGLLGFVLFVVGMSTPLALYVLRRVPGARSTYKRSLAVGLFIYLVVAWSDGAILYIPTMAFYWAVVALLLCANGDHPAVATAPDSPARAVHSVAAEGGLPEAAPPLSTAKVAGHGA